jgi:phthiocerol/phenolphthiocerol synthesis type-I polyketide synthase C
MVASGLPVIGCADLAGAGAGALLPVLDDPAFAAFRAERPPAAEAGLLDQLRAAPRAEARMALAALITEEVARVLRLAPARISADAPLAALGLDSLGGLELRQAVETRTGLAVPLAAVTEDLTVARLAERALAALATPEEGMAPLVEMFEPEAAS